MNEILRVDNLHVSYGPIKAVRGINVSLNRGEAVAIVGANGAGKTTLLKAISQIVRVSDGNVIFNGQSIIRFATSELARRGLVLVPEGRGTIRKLTIYENLIMAFQARSKAGTGNRRFAEALREIYAYFPQLQERSEQMAGSLSGGEQQMLAIAKGLVVRPKVLMLDEPSLGLSPLFVKEIFKIIKRLREEGISVLLVEQNARLALQVADRGYVMANGRVVMDGSGQEMINDNEMLSAYLGGHVSEDTKEER